MENKSTDKTIKTYIKNISSLGKRKLKPFLLNLTIETNRDNIIGKIKNRILERVMQDRFIDPIFESLSSNMHSDKYLEIEQRKKVIILFEDFKNKYGKCFEIAFTKPLPKRRFSVDLPNNLEEQTFIKQLIDIGEITKKSPEIINYTSQMYQALNQFAYWSGKNFVLPTEMDEFQNNSILLWDNEFRAKYRTIKRQISSGTPIELLENEINDLGVELVEYLRRQELSLQNNMLGIELSNGHFYALADKLEIGWHYKWEDKYKKP